MKKIIILIFPFLGICAAMAQQPGVSEAPVIKKSTAFTAVKEKVSVKLYPNPSKNKVELEVKGFDAGLVQVQIINLNGKIERNDQRLLLSGNENLVMMFSLPAGIYFVLLKQKEKAVKTKMIIQ
jgi:hypothetical protein